MAVRLIANDEEWSQAARESVIGESPLIRGRGMAWQRHREAAAFMAGALDRHGYRLLHNGGAPLIGRRWGDWSVEIVLRRHGPACVASTSVTADIHIVNPRLEEIRERYWRTSLPSAGHVGSTNLGRLICSTCAGVIFDLAWPAAAPALTRAMVEHGLLWIDTVTNPAGWESDIDSPLDAHITLELLLAYGGWGRAGRYLHSVLANNPEVDLAVRRHHRRIERGAAPCQAGGEVTRNLAVISSSYGLL